MASGRNKLHLLEGVRGLAAFYVMVGHLAIVRFGAKSSGAGILFQFGQEAVIVFFLLSGFVIHLSVAQKPDMSFREYFVRRAIRIFPIFLIALALSWQGLTSVLAGNIAMLQDFQGGKPGVWVPTYGGNVALWSLSYEWWFYMMYWPIRKLVPVATQRIFVAGLSLVGLAVYVIQPNQISLFLTYFSIWWTGVEMARTYLSGERISLKNNGISAAILGVVAATFAAWAFWYKRQHLPLSFGIHPILELRHMLIAVILILGTCVLYGRSNQLMKALVSPFALVAPISYSIYVLHIPLLVDAHYLDNYLHGPLLIAVYFVILMAAAYFAEGPVQIAINRALLPRRKAAPTPSTPSQPAVPIREPSPDHLQT